jgi:prepilin peptidase CpaA
MLEAAILVIFPMLVAFGGASDLLTMTIQNRVSLLLMAGFAIVALGTGLPLAGWGVHLLGLLPVFLVCFGFFAAGWMGGGDVKFISAIALWIGFTPELIQFTLLVTLYGAGLTLALLSMRQMVVVPGTLARQDWFARLHDSKSGIPYGIAIAVAGLQIYPATQWFKLLGHAS